MVSRPSQCQRGPGEPSVDCGCFALVWPHRRGIWGQGVKTWLCIHSARMLWTIVDLQRRLRCRCHGFVALGSTKGALAGEPSVDCVCLAFVWPHRRGIWGQEVETWLCIHGARMSWAIVDLQLYIHVLKITMRHRNGHGVSLMIDDRLSDSEILHSGISDSVVRSTSSGQACL